MVDFNLAGTAFGLIYFLGIYLHYDHIRTIFHMSDMLDKMDHVRAILNSIFWPALVITYIYFEVTMREEEGE